MANILRDITVDCPPQHVFDVLSNIERLPEFSDMTVRVENCPGRAVEIGDRFEQVVRVAGVEIDTEWEVTEVVVGSRLRLEGRSKSNGRASLTETFIPDGDGTRVQLEVDYDPPLGLLGEIADKLVFERKHEDDAEQILSRLKILCERTLTS